MFRFFRRSPLQYGLIVVLAVTFYVLLGYARQLRDDDSPPPRAASFAEQLAAVQRGEAVEIRCEQEPVGNQQLARLKSLQKLERLNLRQGTFSDAGLAHLAGLPNLTLLRFHSQHVSDEGLRQIAALKRLRFLHLIDVPITDAGLAHLHKMTWLETFYLDGGQVSDEGLYALLEALPELHFHRDQLHLPADPRGD